MSAMLWFGLLLTATLISARHSGPVLLWGDYGTANGKLESSESGGAGSKLPQALARIDSLHFTQVMLKLVERRPVILLFTEPSLSIEDFDNRYEEASLGSTAFPFLTNLSYTPGFRYLPSVEGAVAVVHQLTKHGYSLASYDRDSPPHLSTPTILVATLREPLGVESRQSLLGAHDEHMYEITQDALQRYGQVLVVYTGRHASYVSPSSNRHKRQVEDEEVSSVEIIMSARQKASEDKIYIVTGSPMEYCQGNLTYNLTTVLLATIDMTRGKNGKEIVLDVKFKQEGLDLSLDWVFKSPSQLAGWSLDAVKVEGRGVEMRVQSGQQIAAPGQYSYYCAQDIVFQGVDKEGVMHKLTLHGIQAQPRVSGGVFGPAADCVTYFSQPILTGLLVSAFLLSVLVMAVLLLLDIRSNDRFDDPKSKPLTITNAE